MIVVVIEGHQNGLMLVDSHWDCTLAIYRVIVKHLLSLEWQYTTSYVSSVMLRSVVNLCQIVMV